MIKKSRHVAYAARVRVRSTEARIIKATATKMGLPMEKVIVTVQDHGNTSAASIPLALSVGVAKSQIKPGDLIVTEAIGGGLAWGSVALRW